MLFSTGNDSRFYSYIKRGVIEAKEYGYSQRGPVRLYLDVMLIAGAHFEKDPLYQWTDISREQNTSQIENSSYLYYKLHNYIDTVYGEGDIYFSESEARFKELSAKRLPAEDNQSIDELHKLLKYVHPQRYGFTGSGAVDKLLVYSNQYCDRYELKNGTYKSYVALIMFLFGFSFENDLFRNSLIVEPLMKYIESEDVRYHYEIVSHYASFRVEGLIN